MLLPDWRPGVSYTPGQLVIYENDIWVCNQANSNSAPALNSAAWQVKVGDNDATASANWLYDLFTEGGVFPSTFGAKGDGVTDDSSAFIAAIAALTAAGGGNLIVPYTPGGYAFAEVVNLASNIRVIGIGYPTIKLLASGVDRRVFRLNALTYAGIEGLIIDGTNGVNNPVLFQNVTGCWFERNRAVNWVAPIALTGTSNSCRVSKNSFTDGGSTAIELNGSGVIFNDILENIFEDNVGFGIWITGLANRNTISKNKTSSNGIELIGVTYDSFENIISDNHAEGCGDNGISITGYRNVLSNNVTKGNDFHGLCLYGSYNTVVSHVSLDNGQSAALPYAGIALTQGFGGLAQGNSVSGFYATDSQAAPTQDYGIRINAAGYTAWANGQVISGAGVYRTNDNKLYRSTGAGTTGATPPTWTSGTQSDGAVSWTYLDTFISTINEPAGNKFESYSIGASATASIYDGTTRQENSYTNQEHPGFVVGGQYTLWPGATGNVAIAAVDVIYFYPVYIPKVADYASGAMRIATGGAGSSVKVGIWRNVGGRPVGAPVAADNTGVATTGTGQITINFGVGSLQPGWYWVGTKCTGTPPSMVSTAGAIGMNMPQGSSVSTYTISFGDAYANNMPTLAEGASFSTVNASGAPALALNIQ